MSDPRFELIDAFDRKWLKLKDGASIDHETEPSITVTVTATDGSEPASTDVTIEVTNVNEAPVATGDAIPAFTGTAGEPLEGAEVDLISAFTDPDGDTPVRYTVSGAPQWLTFSVAFGEDNGSPTATGLFTGTPPANADSTSVTVTINAFDAGELSDSTPVRIILDDDVNDPITAVELLKDGSAVVGAEVKENDPDGPVLGEIRVTDADDGDHPNGVHDIQVLKGGENPNSPKAKEDDRFEVRLDSQGVPWLAVKEGSTFDHEKGPFVDIIIRAVDLGGAIKEDGTAFTGNVGRRDITVEVTDENDAPKANVIGNWWVTAEEGLQPTDADGIGQGQWLTFTLDTNGKDAAFTDPDGDPLNYTLSGPAASILEFDGNSARIVNKKGALPIEGVHTLTITASDGDLTAETSFLLAIALSGDGTDATANQDNNDPRFSNLQERNYTEGSGDQVVATFTVTDEDNALGHHPFALESVKITQLVVAFEDVDPDNTSSNSRTINVMTPTDTANDPKYINAFDLSKPVKNGNAWIYELLVRDDPMTPRNDETEILNHEVVRSVEVEVTATDGVLAATADDIDVDIIDRNEAPEVEGVTRMVPAGNLLNAQLLQSSLQQSMLEKVTLYINLEALWDDPDSNQDPDELIFTAESSTPWIRIVHGPVQWDDISDAVTWAPGGASPTGSVREVVTSANPAPASTNDNTWVVIVEIDRTGSNNGQVDPEGGSFTLTATHNLGGPTGTLKVPVKVMDENLHIPADANAVMIGGVPVEGGTLRANFDDNKDPDLRGAADPALVLYRWFRDADDGSPGGTANNGMIELGERDSSATPLRVSTDSTYKLTQSDVGMGIRVEVDHYEIVGGQLVHVNTLTGLPGVDIPIQAFTPGDRPVRNVPDEGGGSITILTPATGNALVVQNRSLGIIDGDYITDTDTRGTVLDTNVAITWEVSDDGGDWMRVDQLGDSDTRSLELRDGTGSRTSLTDVNGDGQGKYYRAVATYNANNDDDGVSTTTEEMAKVYSDPVQVADVRNGTDFTPNDGLPSPMVTGSLAPDGTLTVDPNETGATVAVQWQVRVSTTDGSTNNWVDLDGATDTSLTLTQANAGQTLRAVVSYESTTPNSPGVTAIVPTAIQTVGGVAPPTRPVKLKDVEIKASVDGTGHNPLGSGNNAGLNLSLTDTVNLWSLFQDPDSPRLTFTVSAGDGDGASVGTTDSGLNALTPDPQIGSTYVWNGAAGGVLVFEVDGHTGKLTFNSDVYRGHDGNGDDGAGNVIRLNINASDTGTPAVANPTTAAAIDLHINVAPTSIALTDAKDGGGSLITGNVTVDEHLAPVDKRGDFIAYVNVQDENLRTHEFGTHEVTVSDDRFMVVRNNYDNARAMDDGDGSTWELRLKPGVKLDFETENADTDPTIELTLAATDGGSLSTPSGPGITPITVTVEVQNVVANDPNEPLQETNVPGLNDVDGISPTPPRDDREDGDDDDTDTDGGADPSDPSMDAMMMSTLDDGLF